MARRKEDESGFALLLVFLMAAIIGIMLYLSMPRVVFEAQRAKEQLLIDRGEQYRRAIQLYSRKFPGQYPARLEQLENTNNTRFLRRRYKDPMTGSDEWRLVHIAAGGIFPDSLTMKPPQQKKPGDSSSTSSNTSGGSSGTTDPAVSAIIGPDGQPQAAPAGFRGRGASDRGPLGTGGVPGIPDEAQQGAGDVPEYAQAPGAEVVDPTAGADPGAVAAGQPQPGVFPGQVQQPGMIPGQPPPGSPPNAFVIQPGTGQPVGIEGGMVPGSPGGNPTDPNQPGAPNQPQPPYPTRGIPGLPGPYGQTGTALRPGIYPPQIPGMGPNPMTGQQFGQIGGTPSGSNLAVDAINERIRTGNRGITGLSGGNMTLGAGIAGVASKAESEGIKIYKKHTKYNEWEFIYDPRNDPTTPMGQANLAQQQMQQQSGIVGLGQKSSSTTKPGGNTQ